VGLTVWLYVTRWVGGQFARHYLTAVGPGWRCIVCGGMLPARARLPLVGWACWPARSVHVAIFDLRHLEAIYRILSFLALGVVPAPLGFLYNKIRSGSKSGCELGGNKHRTLLRQGYGGQGIQHSTPNAEVGN